MKKTLTLKLWRLMKICAAQAMIAMIVCGISVAHENYAQLLEKKVTLIFREAPFEDAIKQVQVAAGVNIFYSIDQLQVRDTLSLNATEQPLQNVLDELLSPYGITYRVDEKIGAIYLKRIFHPKPGRELLIDNPLVEQERSSIVAPITGTVTDGNTQQPMAGVNVIVKGTTSGTTTDAEGKYNIEAEENSLLIFSFIGYATVELPVGGRVVIDVVMHEDATDLGEVIVNAGYWEVKETERTGNIVRIEAKDIEKQPVQNALSALQGRVPGLEVIQQTGVPGGNFTVRIRGTNSIANGNDPLYVIDGVPYTSTSMSFTEASAFILLHGTSPLNGINPSDIESIEVLKDADATAIYGSRGANGVILITTKRGRAGKTKVDMNFYSGIGRVASVMELLSRNEYLEMRNEALRNANIIPSVTNAPDLLVWDTTRYTDWQDRLIGGTAQSTDAQFSVSGGDTYNQFIFSGGYHKEGTVFPGNNSDRRFSAHIGLNNTSKDERLKLSLSLKYAINDTDLLKRDLTVSALTLAPVAPPLFTEEGALNWAPGTWTQTMPNPLAYTRQNYEGITKNLLSNVVVGYSIFPSLNMKINLGYSDLGMNTITTTPKSSLPPVVASTQQNESIFSSSSFNNWTVEPQLNWRATLPNGKLDVLVGSTFLDQSQEGMVQYAYGFSSEALMKNIGASSSRSLATNHYSQYRYHAGFARINYVHNARYIINLTGRRDGSSRFGEGKQFANFGAVGAAWIFSEEPFMKNLTSTLSFGKFRASYGVTGNDQLGNYQYLDTYTSTAPYQGIVGLTPVRLANPTFAWETNRKLEGGIELGLLENRIISSLSYYRNRSSNQLVGYPLPPTTGFSIMQANLPAVVENKGIEITVSTRNIDNSRFFWCTSLNISLPKNKLIEFPDLASSPSYANTLVIGEPLSILKRYKYTGINSQTGLYQMDDSSGDGVVNALDRQAVKFVGQTLFGGVLNSLRFKNIQVDFLFQFVQQQRLGYLSAFGVNPGNGSSNQPEWVMDRWRNPDDTDAKTQLFTVSSQGSAAYTAYTASDNAIVDASFLRLKNVAISYSPSSEWLEKSKIDEIRLFVQGQNLLTLSNYKGLDPETGSNSLPPLQAFSAGFHITP